jgi:hypothetical protein
MGIKIGRTQVKATLAAQVILMLAGNELLRKRIDH